MKNESWVLVANGSMARLFRMEKMNQLSEFHGFVHPESRLKEQDLVASEPGRSFDSTGPHRHAMEPHATQKEHEIELFAKNIATYLDDARKNASFSRLYIAAGPSFLSSLRKVLHPHTMELVKKQITKDLVRADKAQILEQVLE